MRLRSTNSKGALRVGQELTYTCRKCGEVHFGLPDFAFEAPTYYERVPKAERKGRTKISSDLCKVDEHRFIRVVLLVPIIGTGESIGWGVWSSLSKRNFQRYLELWDAEDVSGERPYFGWLSNSLPFYPSTLSLKLDLHLRPAGRRPLAELHTCDHPLAIDQRNGIAFDRAVEMAESVQHPELPPTVN